MGLPSNNKKPNSRGAERAPLINDATVRLSDLNNPVKNRVQGSQTSTFLELLCPVILPNFYSLCVGQVRFSVASVTDALFDGLVFGGLGTLYRCCL